ncbi:hypothetical protein EVAR_95490_1 [Eumeta japonica]|uniref:Uncharacterized protein n=1 Tax=Eumeta variegata TaxID=151549 RepID=A0A4C1UJ18_EUMVA|nr:hypothetical protein EVAR_95490_1 [Eumeta japonica]
MCMVPSPMRLYVYCRVFIDPLQRQPPTCTLTQRRKWSSYRWAAGPTRARCHSFKSDTRVRPTANFDSQEVHDDI